MQGETAEALKLQNAAPNGTLRIAATGTRQDGA